MKAVSTSAVYGGKARYKKREFVFLKNRSEPRKSLFDRLNIFNRGIVTVDQTPRKKILNLKAGSSNSSFNISEVKDISQKTPLCPYQYLYYQMLLEHTSDMQFRILGPSQTRQRLK